MDNKKNNANANNANTSNANNKNAGSKVEFGTDTDMNNKKNAKNDATNCR